MHQDLNATGTVAFKKQLYQSMIAQALFIKSEIDGWRSSNVWGTLIWQFNEIVSHTPPFAVLTHMSCKNKLHRGLADVASLVRRDLLTVAHWYVSCCSA